VLEGLIWQQEQLFQILEQHDRRAEQCTGILLGEATPSYLQSANEALHTNTHPVAQSSGLLSAQLSAPAPSSACEGDTAHTPAAGNSSSYLLGLLASASPQEVQEAVSLIVADLQDWHVRLFEDISPLLELAKREQQLPSDQQCSEPYNAAAAAEIAATATWASQPGAGDCDIQQTQQTSSSSSQHSEEPMSSAGTPAPAEEEQVLTNTTAAGLAGDGHPPDAAGAATSCLAVHQEAKQQLEHCVDAAVRVVALQMLHSPLTSNEVAASNLVTKTQAAAPSQHWVMVSCVNW
jgi:hypothetical protein